MDGKYKMYAVSASRKFRASPDLSTVVNNNKYTDVDYEYFEDAWANTIAGAVIDRKMEFVIGGGIKPTFELINTKGLSEEQQRKAISKFDDLQNELMQFDAKPNIAFKRNLYDAAVMAKVFGRCAISFEPEGAKLPDALFVVHPRDLGRVNMTKDFQVSSVMAYNLSTKIMAEEMVYLVNKPNSPVRQTSWYGWSQLQRVIGGARALQRILVYDAPEIAQSMWANYGLAIVNTEGKSPADAQAQLTTIAEGMKAGAINFINGRPNLDVQWIPMDVEAKVGELVQLIDQYERMIIGNEGLPGPLMGREEESNMATLLGKIRLFVAGPVVADREWLSDTISKQWYERIIRVIEPEALKVIRVKAEFEPIITESWIDNVEALKQLRLTMPNIPDKIMLELAGLSQYKNDLAVDQNVIAPTPQNLERPQNETLLKVQKEKAEQLDASTKERLVEKKEKVLDAMLEHFGGQAKK